MVAACQAGFDPSSEPSSINEDHEGGPTRPLSGDEGSAWGGVIAFLVVNDGADATGARDVARQQLSSQLHATWRSITPPNYPGNLRHNGIFLTRLVPECSASHPSYDQAQAVTLQSENRVLGTLIVNVVYAHETLTETLSSFAVAVGRLWGNASGDMAFKNRFLFRIMQSFDFLHTVHRPWNSEGPLTWLYAPRVPEGSREGCQQWTSSQRTPEPEAPERTVWNACRELLRSHDPKEDDANKDEEDRKTCVDFLCRPANPVRRETCRDRIGYLLCLRTSSGETKSQCEPEHCDAWPAAITADPRATP